MEVASPKRSSAEEVATSTRSISSGDSPDISRAEEAAVEPRVLIDSCCCWSPSSSLWVRTRRSEIPVRVRIHSSEVSTTLSRSKLVMTVLGEADPMPMGRQFIGPVATIDNDDDDDDDDDEADGVDEE